MDKELRVKIKIDSETAKLDTLNSKINNTSKGFNEAGSMASSFLSKIGSVAVPVASMYLAVKAIEAVKDAIVYTTTAGIDFNKQLETMQIGITSLIAVSSQNTTATGEVLSAQEKYKISSYQTLEVIQMLKKANLETSATLGELTSGFQSALTPARNAGFSMAQTVEYTKLMTQAAGAMGVPMNQLSQELKSVVSSTIDLNSVVASNLGITNEQIKKHKTQGDLFDFLKTKLADFAVAGTDVSNSFAGSVSNMEDSFLEFASVVTQPLFNELKAGATSTATLFKSLTTVVQDFYDTLKSPFELNSIDQLNKKAIDITEKIANKQEQISNAFSFNKGKYEAELRALNQELNGVVQQYGILNERDKQSSGLVAKKEIVEISSELKKLIDPVDVIKEKYSKLRDELEKGGKATSDNLSKLSSAESKEIADVNKKEREELKKTQDELDKNNKALLDIKQIGMSEYESGLISITEKTNEWRKAGVSENDILNAKNKLLDELNKKTLYEVQKEDLSYYERKIQLQDDSISKELELQGVSYSNKILEIENSTKSIEEKDKLIAKETELFNLTVQNANYKYETEFQNTMSSFYDDMLDSQLALNNAVYDFGAGFDGVSSKVGNLSKSLAAMGALELTNKKEATALDKKYIEQFNKYAGDVTKTAQLEQQYTKDTALLNEQNIQAQINGYANIAGAMSGMFAQGSREAATFQVIESGLAVVSGVRAILSQGSGDPYTAFARMAAMTASVMSLLQSAKIAFGTSSETKSFDAMSKISSNEGAGTILGDTTAQSESIANSMEILKDFAQPQYETLLSMNKYLSAIANGIGGVSSLLVQEGGYAFGAGFTSTDSGWKNKVSTDMTAVKGASFGGAALQDYLTTSAGAVGTALPIALGTMLVDKFLLGGTISKMTNKVLAGIFGKTSVNTKMKDSGMYFADQLLTEATKNFVGSAYQTVETTTTKKSWFDKSTSTSNKTSMEGLSNQTNNQFTMIIDNLYKTTLLAGDALDTATSTVESSLSSFVVSLGKISLYKKSGDEIQKTLEAVFGKLGDQIAGTAFPLLTQFQAIGEGLFTTMTRVATGMEEAEFYIGRLGSQFKDLPYWEIINKRGNVGFEALIQSISRVEASTYPVNNNLMEIVSNLDSTAEELYSVYTALDELRDRLIFIGQSAAGISSSMIKGAGTADSLVDGFNAYFENFLDENEQLKYKTEQLTDEFQKLGLALPVSKDSFKALLSGLDLTSAAGQELYGRLIILSESFSDIAEATATSIEELQTSLDELSTNSFDSFISSLEDVGNTLVSIKNTALGFVQGFSTSSNASLKDQLIAYNKLRSEFSNYFDATGLKAGINEDIVNGLYSQITTLAQNISSKDDILKNGLISQFESDIFNFDSSTDVLRVNIVEGLSKLEGLNEVQKNKLIEASRDGKLTNLELDNIAGLTATQKENIIKFASNSDLFSTEGTLSNLETYAKAQLDIIQKQTDAETSNMSTQTFSYGDYIGKQEQIDISKTLGVSYTSSKDFIEKLQDLSISTDLKKDLSNILGYSGYEYDLTKASQITSLSQYLNPDVATTLNQIKGESGANIEQRNIFEAAKSDFYKRLSFAEQALSSYHQQMQDAQSSYAYWDAKVSKTDNGSSNYDRYKDARYAAAVQIWSVLPNLINSTQSTINSLYEEKALKGFAIGGYTGDIPINAIAGFVHGGEHVLDSSITSQINSIGSVADMVNQYTNTNFYQKMNNTFIDMKKEISNLVKITIDQANEIKTMRKEIEFKGAV